MIHELRIYHCCPGRLPALLKRFEETTLAIWERYDIRPIGFWTVEVGENNHDLYYILEWESLAEREKNRDAFQSDPEWIEKRAASEKGNPIVASVTNYIMKPTTFSKIQ